MKHYVLIAKEIEARDPDHVVLEVAGKQFTLSSWQLAQAASDDQAVVGDVQRLVSAQVEAAAVQREHEERTRPRADAR